jgi:hypothetical protein
MANAFEEVVFLAAQQALAIVDHHEVVACALVFVEGNLHCFKIMQLSAARKIFPWSGSTFG